MLTHEIMLKSLDVICSAMEDLHKQNDANLKYHCLADAVYWDDEIPTVRISWEAENALRFVLGYRTSLIMGKPDEECLVFWQQAKISFPSWIGFSPDRISPDKKVIAFYKENSARFDSELEKLIDEENQGII